MSYRMTGLGAGPGPVRTYKVDLPFPWGDDTAIKLPLDAMVKDAVAAIPMKTLVAAAMAEAVPLVNEQVPQLIATYIDPKLGQAEYIINQTLKDVETTADKAVKHIYIAAALIVAGVGVAAWWSKR